MRYMLSTCLLVCLLASCSKEPKPATETHYTVTYTDEAGIERRRTAPSEEQRSRIVSFPLKGQWGFREGIWLAYGFPLLLWIDLQQDPCLEYVDPSVVEAKIREMGFDHRKSLGVIEARRVAAALEADYHTTGIFSSDGKGIDLRMNLYETRSREKLGTLGTNWQSFFAGADSVSKWLRTIVPGKCWPGETVDRPVAEIATRSAEAMQYLSEGWWRYSRASEFPEAIAYLDRAVDLDSTFALAGLTLYWAGRGILTEAAREEALCLAFRHARRLPESLRLAADAAYNRRRDRDRARRAVTLLTGLYPTEPFAQETGARVLVALGEQDAAAEHFLRAVDLQPSRQRLFESMISLCREAGHKDQALILCRERVKRFPRNADTRIILGQILTLEAQYAAAELELRRAAGIDPGHPRALEGLGLVRFRLGDLKGAQEYFRKGLKTADLTTKARIYIELGSAYFERGMVAKGLEVLEEGRRDLASMDPVLSWRLEIEAGKHIADLGNFSFALEKFRSSPLRREVSLAWIPELAEAEVLVRMGRLNEAHVRVVGTTAVIEHPGVDQAALEMTILGEIAWARSDYDDALQRFSFVRALEPADRKNLLRLAGVYFEQERWAAADSVLSDARRFFPHDPHVHAEIARVRESERRFPEAIARLEEAARLWENADPGIPYVEEARRRLENLKKKTES
ncbi:MAG: tetratricopeptide repeat protein [Candidatus Eisenbacteria sp.]|nr:tetratricopeptide repeat protein [Candidatus Eisenbacteria bacterium]